MLARAISLLRSLPRPSDFLSSSVSPCTNMMLLLVSQSITTIPQIKKHAYSKFGSRLSTASFKGTIVFILSFSSCKSVSKNVVPMYLRIWLVIQSPGDQTSKVVSASKQSLCRVVLKGSNDQANFTRTEDENSRIKK